MVIHFVVDFASSGRVLDGCWALVRTGNTLHNHLCQSGFQASRRSIGILHLQSRLQGELVPAVTVCHASSCVSSMLSRHEGWLMVVTGAQELPGQLNADMLDQQVRTGNM